MLTSIPPGKYKHYYLFGVFPVNIIYSFILYLGPMEDTILNIYFFWL